MDTRTSTARPRPSSSQNSDRASSIFSTRTLSRFPIFKKSIPQYNHNTAGRTLGPALSPQTPHPPSPSPRRHNISTRSSAPAKPLFQWVRGDLIGKGSFGKVYLGIIVTTGDIMAVKQVEMPKADRTTHRHQELMDSLRFESKTLKELDHPNIVQYLGFEEGPNFMNIFLEYIPGGTIGSCLHRHGRFDHDTTRSFTKQILNGLHYLHSCNIIHRDMKADNVLVERSGVCKISDFGISKRLEDIETRAHTMLKGTLFWMAPEVIQAKNGYGSKVDIWSVGCITLEMWSGVRPWHGMDFPFAMFQLGMNRQAPPVPADVSLPSPAEDFRRLCFAADPLDRPSAAQLALHPYLHLPPGWQFNPQDIERKSTRRRSRASGKHSIPPSFKHIPPMPPLPPTVSRPSIPNERNHHAHSRFASTSGLPMASSNDGPQVVVVSPIPPLEPSPPWNDNKSDTSSASKEGSTLMRRRKGRFIVANPDGDAKPRPYVYNPPPLPNVPKTQPSNFLDVRQPTMRHAISQPNFRPNGRSESSQPPYNGPPWDDAAYYSGSESEANEEDTDASLWQKKPVDFSKALQKRQSIMQSKRQSAWGRPGLDDVYNNIGEYFHEHDIDKPISRGDEEAYREELSRVKSNKTLRMVAEEQVYRSKSNATHKQRRKTKLWETRIEEVSAGEALRS